MDAVQAIAEIRGAGDIEPEVVAHDRVTTATVEFDAVSREAIDDQAANRGSTGRHVKAVDTRPGRRSVEFNDRRTGEVRLAPAVDDHRLGDCSAGRMPEVNRMRTGAGDVEVNLIQSRQGIRIEDRLPQ